MTQTHSMEIAPATSPFPVRSNPRAGRDYILSLNKTVTVAQLGSGVACEIDILIRYVPDRLICDTTKMPEYFESIASRNWNGAEELANAITDEICDELIPRWIRVSLTLSVDGLKQSVLLVDKQPLWDNPSLLQRFE